MKAILRKGAVACAAMLMGANVMAQENVFVEHASMSLSTNCYFMPQEFSYDGASKALFILYEEADVYYGYASYKENVPVGYRIINPNLEVEKEIKTFTASEAIRTRINEKLENGNWVEKHKSQDVNYGTPFFIRSANSNTTTVVGVSQTLFNDDDKYEVIVPVYSKEFIRQENEGSTSRTVYRNFFVTALNIVNEAGEILHTLDAGNDSFFHTDDNACVFIEIGDKIYFSTAMGSTIEDSEYWYENYTGYRWYEICKKTNSINFVRETRGRMNIRPTVANRDEQITITLNDENSNTARELIITGVNGQLVDRRDIPAGESTVTVSAAMMRSGMYNFTLQKKGEIMDNGKVIVK